MDELHSDELAAAYVAGEEDAARALVDRYLARLLALVRARLSPRLAQRIDAEDVVQSAYRSFFVHARDGAYVFQRAGDLWRLLSTIAINKLRSQAAAHQAARRDVRRETSPPRDAGPRPPLAGREPTPDEAAAVVELLEQFMAALSPLEREVLEQRLQGATVESIGERVGRSQRTVRRLLRSIRVELEGRLANG